MTALDDIAREAGASGRTLRRAAARGTIRSIHPSPHRFALDPREREYVRRHWGPISHMLQVLRTRPDVSLAVLYGSFSRGDERPGSDVDVLVQLADPSLLALSSLIDRLEEELERPVQLVELESAEESPSLLAEVMRDGRVLVDRARVWERLKRHEPEIVEAAAADNARAADELAAALEELFV